MPASPERSVRRAPRPPTLLADHMQHHDTAHDQPHDLEVPTRTISPTHTLAFLAAQVALSPSRTSRLFSSVLPSPPTSALRHHLPASRVHSGAICIAPSQAKRPPSNNRPAARTCTGLPAHALAPSLNSEAECPRIFRSAVGDDEDDGVSADSHNSSVDVDDATASMTWRAERTRWMANG
ncbi:hypothetical protein B0H12DRAFT_1238514 [Mycena haematopus]|nr:hypothetical protein B0H12DRAFT_1238514 [Mycena haematopus]